MNRNAFSSAKNIGSIVGASISPSPTLSLLDSTMRLCPPLIMRMLNVLVMDLQQMSVLRILIQLKLSNHNLKQMCKNQLYENILPR